MFEIPRAGITVPSMNPWETRAMAHNFPAESPSGAEQKQNLRSRFESRQDPIIYPGLYAPSGIDIMTVLFSVLARPDPKIDLGPVDCSAALTVSNLDLPGSPIIYANDAFAKLTGYTVKEVLGRDVRFLHTPQSVCLAAEPLLDQHIAAIQELEQATASRDEIQLSIANYKKNGEKFTNLLSMIPIRLPDDKTQYSVGFHGAMD
ncbi:vivid PAS protein VVD [Beauveria bassiana ARSEF 2860]|uniref:Vivid PAS protein VVD n=1 Tax=Beauveria bassiana (strain ARSEF 2860) TaxID=655819 RepID=J4WD57_BEAB2|nr:vivid PAS protein VVD [Beauveria bassiana ARSEF 2860]EJP67980.1 vivid PAS protein VVD [Beauveria bassiana ARSEF 2860]